ncbi:MAG: hypothetical protein PF503_11690, partial [Desulfobacula sp.]|nr:hypothetical protein [Desulfobacula sp.]
MNNSSNNIPSSIRDNHKRGSIGDFLKEQADKGSQLSIISAFFTIYAYKKLKNKLDSIKSLNFLFGDIKAFHAFTSKDKDVFRCLKFAHHLVKP